MTDTSKEQGINYEAWADLFNDISGERLIWSSDLEEFASAIRSDILRRAKEKSETYHWQDGITGDYEKNQIEAISIEDLTALCTEDLTKEEKI